MANPIKVIDWGFKPYEEALVLQQSLVDERKRDAIEDTIVFTEHEPVYTIGSRSQAIKHLKISDKDLQAKNIALHKTNRGGDITFHGPGQLVIYPILKLLDKDLHAYLRQLEQAVIGLLKHYNLSGILRDGKTGIWIENRKICALGIAVRSWVSYHGLALNLDTDLSYFDHIVPCGISDGSVTSLKNEGVQNIDKNIIKERFIVEFTNFFYD